MVTMDIRDYNRAAWDHQVATGNRWTVPVSPEVIAAARRGEWSAGFGRGRRERHGV